MHSNTILNLNNISAVSTNTLYYGEKGKVEFASGTPISLRLPFLQEGSGNNLQHYDTYVSLNKEKNMVNITVNNTTNFFKKMLHKLGIKSKAEELNKTINIFSGNHQQAAREIKEFISSGEISNFFKELKPHRKLANYLISMI